MGLLSFRKELLVSLCSAGHIVLVSSPHDEERERVLSEIGCEFIPTEVDRRGKNPMKDIRLISKYRRIIMNNKPGVVLSYTIKPNLYGGLACRSLKVPQIVNITGLGTAVETPGLLQYMLIIMYRVCLKEVEVMFFQNKANMSFCEKHAMINGRPILIPGSGVNVDNFTFSPMPDDNVIKFIFIGRVMKQKGIEEYLDMAEIVKNKYSNTEFHVLGPCDDGEYSERIQSLQESGVIVYDGTTTDVRPFLRNVHCTVHPSFYPEGMSNVLLESCASGRAIITTNRPGCGEIVVDGVTGYVCRERDSLDLVAKVDEFINLDSDTRLAMGRAARQRVERDFNREIVINAYMSVINDIFSRT